MGFIKAEMKGEGIVKGNQTFVAVVWCPLT